MTRLFAPFIRLFERIPADDFWRERLFESLDTPFTLTGGPSTPSRTLAHFGDDPIVFQTRPLIRKRPDLVQRAGAKHCVEAGLGTGVKLLARDVDEDALHRDAGQRRLVLAVALPVEKRAARGINHLKRTGEALAIGGQELRSHGGVAAAELGMKVAREAAPMAAHLVRDLRHGREAQFEGAEVKPGAAGDDGEKALLPRRLHLAAGFRQP